MNPAIESLRKAGPMSDESRNLLEHLREAEEKQIGSDEQRLDMWDAFFSSLTREQHTAMYGLMLSVQKEGESPTD